MRKWIYEAVKSTPGQTEMFGDRIMTTGAVEGPGGVDDMPQTPFIVNRMGTNELGQVSLPGTTIRQETVQVWIHDTPGSLLDTDDFCEALRRHLPTQAPDKREDEIIIECEYRSTSGDGFDDHFQTDTRYVTFKVTYKTLP